MQRLVRTNFLNAQPQWWTSTIGLVPRPTVRLVLTGVSIDPVESDEVVPAPGEAALSEAEADALARAGAWYANYHARMITERADDESAYAVAKRERYDDLVSGLRKLGVRIPGSATLGRDQAA